MSSTPTTPTDDEGTEARVLAATPLTDDATVSDGGGLARRQAAIAGHTGDSGAARSLLDHPVAKVRATALGALNRMSTLREGELCRALTDIDPGVRRRACEETARWSGAMTPSNHRTSDGDPLDTDSQTNVGEPDPHEPLPDALAEALTDRLLDEDQTVVEIAAWAWGERPPAIGRAFELILSITANHEDALCREAAVAALGALGDIRALPTILQATKDRATVRRRAIIALAPFDGPEVDEALERARTDRDWQVRQAAEDLSS